MRLRARLTSVEGVTVQYVGPPPRHQLYSDADDGLGFNIYEADTRRVQLRGYVAYHPTAAPLPFIASP